MNNKLEPRKLNLNIRMACLVLLLGIAPFALVGMHNEGNDYGIFFFLFILVVLIPELYIRLFLKPVSAMLEENHIVIKYYLGTQKDVYLGEMGGYSRTEERMKYNTKSGILIYLKNGKCIDFTDINIRDTSPLISYFDSRGIPNYGFEKLRPWFLRKYKYDNK